MGTEVAWWGWDFGMRNQEMSPFCFAGLLIRERHPEHTHPAYPFVPGHADCLIVSSRISTSSYGHESRMLVVLFYSLLFVQLMWLLVSLGVGVIIVVVRRQCMERTPKERHVKVKRQILPRNQRNPSPLRQQMSKWIDPCVFSR
jgi:hypothetical protein